MRKIKWNTLFNIILVIFIIIIIIYNKEISTFIVNNYIYNKNATMEIKKNKYAINKNYKIVQITDDFVAKDYQHLLNIIYTILDSGEKEFYFYCDAHYKSCMDDIDKIIPNENTNNKYDILSDINNLVHPFNSYTKLTVVMNNYGKVIIKIYKQYNEEDINYINKQIDIIDNYITKPNMTEKNRLLAFHDYIINTTAYDKERANDMTNEKYNTSISHTASGLLKNHIALCGGYSDMISIYANKLNIPNMRISADKHVWNLVNIDNKWSHIDATWDDPVTNTGKQILLHDYFLIDTKSLQTIDENEHNFNTNFYKEAQQKTS